ncbi:DNA-processing protein DprA [Microbacterium sp. ZW T5_45]|uniref:DNA-processing protein DprA n=1 Tax=Microbacterium sp. ZW T5_45 TaxID=3378080 RepID=UPI00385300BA
MIEELRQDHTLHDAISVVRRGGDAGDSLARIAWNVITEPGDGVAGALIEEFGAEVALGIAMGDVAAVSATSVPATSVYEVSDVHAVLSSTPGSASRALSEARARWRPRASLGAVRDAATAAAEVGARLLLPEDDEWPRAVDDLGLHAPVALWVRGEVGLLACDPRVAIVGARASSGYGEMIAAEFAGDLAASGAVVVSGGAYGIDGAAHRAALGVGGATIALLAGGVDRAYPQGHQQLLRAIAASGAVVSEVPCGTAPTKWRFLSRNRIIAALGDATVVVEAGWRSGSLNTAGHAAALGRPLGAVPGPVTSAASAGCHRLLREYDARCVTTAAEVRELWGDLGIAADPRTVGDPEQTRLLDSLSSRSRIPVAEIARRSGLSIERVSSLLGLLDLEGRVDRADGGWRRTPPGRM